MKNLTQYIKESEKDGKNGHYEDFVDEDTGEIVTLWVDDPNPDLEQLKWNIKWDKFQETTMKKVREIWFKCEEQSKEITKKIEKLEDEIWGYEQDLKDAKRKYRQLQIDQDEEIGALYSKGKYKEGEEKAQEYGEQFNKLADEIELLKNKIKKIQPEIEKLEIEREKIYEPYYKADEEADKEYDKLMGK